MFESLSDRLNEVFSHLRGKGRLSAGDVDATLREVRLALLEADVNVSVARNLLGRIKERAVGEEISKSLTPAQQVIKVVHEELIGTLGGTEARLASASSPPLTILMVGLQGSGKTTSAAKLAGRLKQQGKHRSWWRPIFSDPRPSISWRRSANASECRYLSTGPPKPRRWSGRP